MTRIKSTQVTAPPPAWHATSITDVLTIVGASEAGLSAADAGQRLVRNGPNVFSDSGGPSWVSKLLRQFIDPLVVVLLGAAVLSVVLRDYADAAVIGAVVVVNAIIGFLQEYRAERAIEALGKMVTTEATVLRDGAQMRVPSEALVAGDIVFLQSGDTVPADLRLVSTKELKIDEAALTGESVPVEKSVADLPEATGLGDRRNLAFAGSAVTYGQARGVVVATGDATQAGRVAHLMASTRQLETPLTRRISQLSHLLVWIILGVAAALFGIQALRGRPLDETFNAAVALAVGAIPEGLPAAVTILLAVGVSSMAKRRALIRRLPAVETLGSTTVICSDKTGTLTENQMTVTTLVVAGETLAVHGVGFDASGGSFSREGESIDPTALPTLIDALRGGLLCNDARVVGAADAPKIEGDPTEAALVVVAKKAELDEATRAAWPRLDVVPFESQHMYMATLHTSPGGGDGVLYVKGSPEALLARSVAQCTLRGDVVPLDPQALREQVDSLAEKGLRVLVVARRSLPPGTTDLGHEHVNSLTVLALLAMIDPPRPEAKRAVAICREAGIAVKMITGDHAKTASAIANELGLDGERTASGALRAVTGDELARVTPEALPGLAENVAVFARVTPEQKLNLVRALQRRGHVVAMTGDGVNDAPALKQADIGVAMGRSGTDVARSAAAMILTDDNFATIEAAVEEGRGVYENLVKFIAWSLPTNGGEGLVLLAAILLDTVLPVLPVQLLWVNLATTVLLGTALIFEPREPGLMQRPPRHPNAPILDRGLVTRTVLVSFLIGAAAFGLFEWAEWQGLPHEQARTIAINTIVVMEVGYLFACRSLRLSLLRIGLFSNLWVWVGAAAMLLAQLLFTYAPLMNRLFHSAPIEWWWWGVMTCLGGAVLVLAELKKLISGLRRAAHGSLGGHR